MAVKRLHGIVDVENPRQKKDRCDGFAILLFQPLKRSAFIHFFEGSAHDIFADCFTHAQQVWVHAIAPNGVDVNVAPMAIEHAEQDRANDISGITGAIAPVAQWNALDELRPAPTRFQKLEKEHE